MFTLKRPGDEQVAAFLARQVSASLTYAPPGISSGSPVGYNIDECRVGIGSGGDTFERAKAAIDSWGPFDIGWAKVSADRLTPEPGTNVAILVKHFGFWSLNACRVIERIAEPGRYGFFYGTLEDHAEQGEELFTVEHDPSDDSVTYEIRAVSRPRALLARLGYPVSRSLQKRFRTDSGDAMRRATG